MLQRACHSRLLVNACWRANVARIENLANQMLERESAQFWSASFLRLLMTVVVSALGKSRVRSYHVGVLRSHNIVTKPRS